MPKDNLARDDGGLGDVNQRVRDLETANPLENGSVDNGTLTIRSSSDGLVIEAGGKFWAKEGAQILLETLARIASLQVDGQTVLNGNTFVDGQFSVIDGNSAFIDGTLNARALADLQGRVNMRDEVYMLGIPERTSLQNMRVVGIGSSGRLYSMPWPSGDSGSPGGGGGGTGLQWPFPESSVSSEFGPRDRDDGWHNGRDFAQPGGTPIPSAGAGVVTASSYGSWQGNYVQVQHGYVGNVRIGTGYMHMQTTPPVSVGQNVQMGDILGPVGTTGDSDGNHCHFEFYENGVRIDPRIGFERYQNSTFTANPT